MDKSPTRNTSSTSKLQSAAANRQFCLTGSQVNLVSRSQSGILKSPTCGTTVRKSRPSSALPTYHNMIEIKSKWKRPLSADNGNLKRRYSQSSLLNTNKIQSGDNLENDKLEEAVSNLRSSYTVSSSRLLRSLLGEPWNSEGSEISSNTSDCSNSEKSLGKRIQEMAQASSNVPFCYEMDKPIGPKTHDFKDTDSDLTKGGESHCSTRTESTLCLQDLNKGIIKSPPMRVKILPKANSSGDKGKIFERDHETEQQSEELLDMKFQRWFPHSGKQDRVDEKTVRFSEDENDIQLRGLLRDDLQSDDEESSDFDYIKRQGENLANLKSCSSLGVFYEEDNSHAIRDDVSVNTAHFGDSYNHSINTDLSNVSNQDFAPAKANDDTAVNTGTTVSPRSGAGECITKHYNSPNLNLEESTDFKQREQVSFQEEQLECMEHVISEADLIDKKDYYQYTNEAPERDVNCNKEILNSPVKIRENSPVLIDLTDDVGTHQKCCADCPFSCCQSDIQDFTKNLKKFKEDTQIEEKKDVCAGTDFINSMESSRGIENVNRMLGTIDDIHKSLTNTPRDSTYEDIVSILHVLEQEEAESMLTVDPAKFEPEVLLSPKGSDPKANQLKDIYSYLDEVERCSEQAIDLAKTNIESVKSSRTSSVLPLSTVPRLDDLLNKNTVELSHEVLSLRLQIEDQSSGIKLLQQTISEMKETARQFKLDHQEALSKANCESDAAIQRHQKFIKQLLNEKKALNEKVSSLVEELKSGEERYQRNLKAVEERHVIEIQRVKETQAAAERLKRDRWIDTKTQKIKEMTVKGLEPELARMAARQQQEMTELRNLHRAELEAVELRATRRTTELLDQLRCELAKDKEEAIHRETAALRLKLEKQMEDEQINMQHQVKRLKEEVRREKERIANQEAQMQDTLMETKRASDREREKERQRLIQEFQEKIEANQRRHQNELKSLKDTLEIEKEAWMNNYRKQQTTKFLEREAELHHQYKRERDREIEMVIERLENEATQARLEMSQAAENKLRRLREKLECEIKEIEASETALKQKLTETKSQLAAREDTIVELNSQLRHLQTEMVQLKKLCEEMSAERADLKEVIRKEFENQLTEAAKDMEVMKNEISIMKTNQVLELAKRDQLALQAKAEAQKELNQVYNRVKMTVSKKEEALEALREQHRTALERCSHLEQMLDNQRRNLLLK